MLALFFLLFSYAILACEDADPSRVVIFVDTNFSLKEVEAAQRSACKNGQTLKVLPPDWKVMGKDMYRYVESGIIIENHCSESSSNYDKNKCERARSDHEMYDNRMEAHVKKYPMPSREMLRDEVEKISKNDGKLEGMVFSGHDGSGFFSGDFGDHELSHEDLDVVLKEFPEQRKNIKSLYLLGCYTGIRSDIENWKLVLPNLGLLMGYEGTAPLNYWKSGHDYIEDMLAKTQDILDAKAADDIRWILQNEIDNIFYVDAAVYIKPNACLAGDNGSNEFYYRISQKGKNRFQDYSDINCEDIMEDYNLYRRKFLSRYTGSTEPEDFLEGNPLRFTYKYFRQNAHCFEKKGVVKGNEDSKVAPDPDQVLNLLFWHHVKDNFGKYFKDDIEKLNEILAKFKHQPEEELLKAIKDVKETDEKLTELRKKSSDLLEEISKFNVDNEIFKTLPEEFTTWFKKSARGEVLPDPDFASMTFPEGVEDYVDQAKQHSWNRRENNKTVKEINKLYKEGATKAQRKLVQDEKIRMTNLADLSQKRTRKEILEFNHMLTGVISNQDKFNQLEHAEQEHLLKMRNRAEKHLYRLQCIPLTWIEENETPGEPRC